MNMTNKDGSIDFAKRNIAIDGALAEINKMFGKGVVMRMDKSVALDIKIIPTGSIGVDNALGVGGIPRGRITEIYGPESSGKTTLCLSIIAEAQKQGLSCLFIDTEHTFDPVYAQRLGISIKDLIVSQPDYGEQALEIMEIMIRSNAIDLVILDSVAALTPKAEIEGDMGDSHMGLQARLMSQALRKLTAITSRTNATVIFTNQIRMKIGVMFGSPETTTGGNALKFYASVRLDIRKINTIKEKEDVIGVQTRVKVVKNKVAPPYKQAEFDIMYNQGISKVGEVVDYGVQFGLIEKSGSWYSLNGEKIGQGKENAKNFFKQNQDKMDIVEKMIKEKARNLNNLEFKSSSLINDIETQSEESEACKESTFAGIIGDDEILEKMILEEEGS
jgi:recombination protein RecA